MDSLTTLLSAREIAVRYENQAPPVLTDLAITLQSGEFVGVVGPNGSGKSTLVRTLSRTLRPVAGIVCLDERDLYADVSARESAQWIGVVPQSAAVTFGFTVREVVRMGRAPHLPRRPFAGETADDERIVAEALEDAGVAALTERVVTTLSGGEWQRVLLARALAQQTAVILLDEPTAHLDIRHQWETLALLRSLAHRRQKAVLAVLHDLNLAATYCDRLLLLSESRIVAQGLPGDVLTSAMVERVYGAEVWVRHHPITGRPVILALPELAERSEALPTSTSTPRVHVVCGAGTGAGLLLALHRCGIHVTVAGLNRGDTDQEAAVMLGLGCAEESPFTPLTPETLAKSQALARQAGQIVVTDVPFGWANLANLDAVAAWQRDGKRVLCLETPGSRFEGRDYTGGQATQIWNRLRQGGANFVSDIESALAVILTTKED